MSTLTIRRVVVRGRVQGVGYRAWTEDSAILNGLDGWVRNRRDGTVEAVFAGAAASVDAMIEACRRGPGSARVDVVEVHDAGPSERSGPMLMIVTVSAKTRICSQPSSSTGPPSVRRPHASTNTGLPSVGMFAAA